MMLAATCFVVFGVAALASTGSALGNKALTSADVQLVCTLSDALKRSAATALAQSTNATLAVERRALQQNTLFLILLGKLAARRRNNWWKHSGAWREACKTRRGAVTEIGVAARLYALEAAQRAGKMDDMVQLFATYDGNPGTGKICIVTGAATTAKTSTDDAGPGWMGRHAEEMQDTTGTKPLRPGSWTQPQKLSARKEAIHDGRRTHRGGVDGCMLLSSALIMERTCSRDQTENQAPPHSEAYGTSRASTRTGTASNLCWTTGRTKLKQTSERD
ncbi:hypothetical protein ERJ75_001077600 [Trypanosoma vivax]|nr:hypothetical protein ERJ75_001077600 [Trypanosoma vivax]